METLSAGFRGLKLFLRLNMDWLCFSAVLLIALYSGAYLTLLLSAPL